MLKTYRLWLFSLVYTALTKIASSGSSGLSWLQIHRWWHGIKGQDINITEGDIIIGLETKKFKLIKQEQLNKIMTVVNKVENTHK